MGGRRERGRDFEETLMSRVMGAFISDAKGNGVVEGCAVPDRSTIGGGSSHRTTIQVSTRLGEEGCVIVMESVVGFGTIAGHSLNMCVETGECLGKRVKV